MACAGSRGWYRYRKLCAITLLLLLFLLTCILVVVLMYDSDEDIACHVYTNGFGIARHEVTNTIPANDGKALFFHETSCRSWRAGGKLVLNPRQACAVESAAKLHPECTVYLLYYAGPNVTRSHEQKTAEDAVVEAMLSYDNIKPLAVDFARYTKGSIVEGLWDSNGRLQGSRYGRSHASDVLRYLTLWKYGGVYLDLDVVLLKKLGKELGDNYAGRESNTSVAAGVLGLSAIGLGHDWATKALTDLAYNFNGKDWGGNGPGVITRLLMRVCGTRSVVTMSKCSGFKVLAPSAFYPIPWRDWEYYFLKKHASKVQTMSKDSYILHVWNKHSSRQPVEEGSAYDITAKKHCPRVWHASRDQF